MIDSVTQDLAACKVLHVGILNPQGVQQEASWMRLGPGYACQSTRTCSLQCPVLTGGYPCPAAAAGGHVYVVMESLKQERIMQPLLFPAA